MGAGVRHGEPGGGVQGVKRTRQKVLVSSLSGLMGPQIEHSAQKDGSPCAKCTKEVEKAVMEIPQGP